MKVNDQRTHIDLFSGIGGFALAANAAGYDTRVFCEQDDYCTGGLNRHWPGVPVIRDIREFDGSKWRGADLLTGGFPCQGQSHAGKRLGSRDPRWLWKEMHRVICDAAPRYVLAENVPGLITVEGGVLFESVCTDLEDAGYEVLTFILPACSKNAPHRRDRIWLVANLRGEAGTKNPDTDSKRPHREEVHQQGKAELPDQQERDSGSVCEDVAHASEQGLQGTEQPGTPCENTGASRPTAQCGGFTRTNWLIEPDVGFLADGIPSGLAGGGWWDTEPDIPRVATGIKDRTKKLMALGNAIVPQVAYEIIRLMDKQD